MRLQGAFPISRFSEPSFAVHDFVLGRNLAFGKVAAKQGDPQVDKRGIYGCKKELEKVGGENDFSDHCPIETQAVAKEYAVYYDGVDKL